MSMKTNKLTLILAGSAMLLSGCVNPDGSQNNTGTGALIGGAFGALTGAALGGYCNGGQDTLIGAAAGALVGGLIGNSADQEQRARLRAQAPQTYVKVEQGQPLAVADVKALAKAGISEDVIISQIKSSRTVYHLSAADIIDLRDCGVSDRVVNYMIDTPATVGANTTTTSEVIVPQAPPPAPAETVVVAPGPDYVWIGGEWDWAGGGWVWRAGYWGHPPYGYHVWMSGRNWQDDRGWHCERGYWR